MEVKKEKALKKWLVHDCFESYNVGGEIDDKDDLAKYVIELLKKCDDEDDFFIVAAMNLFDYFGRLTSDFVNDVLNALTSGTYLIWYMKHPCSGTEQLQRDDGYGVWVPIDHLTVEQQAEVFRAIRRFRNSLLYMEEVDKAYKVVKQMKLECMVYGIPESTWQGIRELPSPVLINSLVNFEKDQELRDDVPLLRRLKNYSAHPFGLDDSAVYGFYDALNSEGQNVDVDNRVEIYLWGKLQEVADGLVPIMTRIVNEVGDENLPWHWSDPKRKRILVRMADGVFADGLRLED